MSQFFCVIGINFFTVISFFIFVLPHYYPFYAFSIKKISHRIKFFYDRFIFIVRYELLCNSKENLMLFSNALDTTVCYLFYYLFILKRYI